jgi:3-hydroxyacyl-CoA dehydrogenase
MCAGGNPVSAPEALALGLIDRVIDVLTEEDLLSGALNFAREVAGNPAPKTRERVGKLGADAENATIFAAARAGCAKKQRGLKAPLAAIDAVEAATKLSFEEGCAAEAKLFDECLFSDQSKALIHVFFGEREVAKIPDVPRETPVIPVNRVAIVGSGTMGGGIAMVFANAGIPVLLKDVDQTALDQGMSRIRKNYANSVQRGRFSQASAEERLQLITPVLTYDAFSGVDLVIEAVFEGMALKKSVFADLDRACRPGAILASNTSTLNIDEIAAATSRPEAVIGTHFFSPANVMRCLRLCGERNRAKK